MTDTLQPVEIPTMYLPSYFKNAFDEDDSWYNSVCCKSTSWVEEWLKNIGASIG